MRHGVFWLWLAGRRSCRISAKSENIANSWRRVRSKCSRISAVTKLRVLKLLRLRDHVLRHPERAQERLGNSLEIIRNARQHGDWAALFEGEWARKVSSFQLGTAGGDVGLEVLEHAALMAGPKYRCIIPALEGFRLSSAAVSPKARTLRELPRNGWGLRRHGVAGSALAGDDDAARRTRTAGGIGTGRYAMRLAGQWFLPPSRRCDAGLPQDWATLRKQGSILTSGSGRFCRFESIKRSVGRGGRVDRSVHRVGRRASPCRGSLRTAAAL